MKRLLVLMPNLRMGGAQRSLLSMLNELDKTKIAVTLVLFNREGELIKNVPSTIELQFWDNYYECFQNRFDKNAKIDLIKAVGKFEFRYIIQRIQDILKYRLLKNLHEEQRIWKVVEGYVTMHTVDYDICLSYMQGTATYFLIDKILTKGKKIAMMNTDYEKAGYNAEFDVAYFDKLDKIVCVSQQAMNTLKRNFKSYADKIITIENVMSSTEIQQQAKEECELSLEKNDITIVSCGRLEKEIKGYDMILEVAKMLSYHGYQFKWYIMGDGSDRKWLEEEIHKHALEGKLILLGTVLNPYPIIQLCDIFVHAARFEGKGRVIKEAKFLKKAIVSTDFDTAFSEIRNEQDGLIVKKTAEDIYLAVSKLIDNPDLRKELCSNINIIEESGIEEYHELFNI